MKNLFIFKIILIILSNNYMHLLSQEPCGEITDCPNKNYLYNYCDAFTHNIVYLCDNQPQQRGHLYPLKTLERICLQYQETNTYPPINYLPYNNGAGVNPVETFNVSHMQNNLNNPDNDLGNAEDAWNCLCGWSRNSPCCTTYVKFSDNWKDLGLDSDKDSRISTRGAGSTWIIDKDACNIKCDPAQKICLNSSLAFAGDMNGYRIKSFTNQYYFDSDPNFIDKINQMSDNGYCTFNLSSLITHELGHQYGLTEQPYVYEFDDQGHPHKKGCQPPTYEDGVMIGEDNNTLHSNLKLSIDDICLFKKLYCPELTPVKEEYAQNKDDELNGYNYSVKKFQLNYDLHDNVKIIKVGIYNYLGQYIMTLPFDYITSVNHKLILNCSDLSYGFYYVVIQTDTSYLFCKLLLNQ